MLSCIICVIHVCRVRSSAIANLFVKVNAPQVHFIQAFAPVAVSVESILNQFKNAIVMVHGTDLEQVLRNNFVLNCTKDSAEAMGLPSPAKV